MILESIKLAGFGTFAEPVEFSFRKKAIGLIYGPNEAGKSTIIAALFAALYGVSPAQKKLWRSWWGGEDFTVELVFREGKKKYRLERNLKENRVRLVRDGRKSKVLYHDYHLPSPKFDRIYFQAFQKIFFLPPLSILKATFVVHEHELRVGMDAGLRRLITGTSETDYEDVLEVLESEYYSLTRQRLPWQPHGGRRNDQLLEKKLNERQELQRQLELAQQYFHQQQSLQKQLLQQEEKLKRLRQRLPRYRELLKNLRTVQELHEKIQVLSRQKEEITTTLEQVESLIRQKDRLQQEIENRYPEFLPHDPSVLEKELSALLTLTEKIEDYDRRIAKVDAELQALHRELEQFPDFSRAPEDFPFVLTQMEEEEQQLPDLEKALQEAEGDFRRNRGKYRVRLWLAIVLFLLAGGTGVGGYFLAPFSVITWGLTSLFAFASLMVGLQEVLPARKQLKQTRGQWEELRVVLEQKQISYRENQQKVEPFLVGSLHETKIRFAQFQELQKRLEQVEARLHSLHEMKNEIFSEKRYQELKDKYQTVLQRWQQEVPEAVDAYRNLQKQLFACEQQLVALPALEQLQQQKERLIQEIATYQLQQKQITQRSSHLRKFLQEDSLTDLIARVNREIEKMQQTQADLESEIAGLRVRVQNPPHIAYHPEQVAQELQELTLEIHQLEKRKQALQLAMEVLRESVREFQNAYLEKIHRYMQEWLEKLLPQNRLEVHLNPDFHLKYRYDGIEIVEEQLSSGTRDQLFFIYRLVLAQLLLPLFQFPLIIDDAFVHFDPIRKENVFKILHLLKKEHQILVFSSDPQLKEYCDYVIELDGGSTGK